MPCKPRGAHPGHETSASALADVKGANPALHTECFTGNPKEQGSLRMPELSDYSQRERWFAALNERVRRLSIADLRKVYVFARTLQQLREEDSR